MLTLIAGLVLELLEGWLMSDAVRVASPAVRSVTEKFLAPAIKAAFAGKEAFASVEVRPTVSVALVTTLKKPSTACTVTLNAPPAVWATGVPVLPEAVAGAADSPGTNSCSLVNAPALTTMFPDVIA